MTKSLREQMLDALADSGMSIAELSRRSGVTYDVLNKLKRGSSQSTSSENAVRIANALGFSLDEGPDIQRVGLHEEAPAFSTLVPVYEVAASGGAVVEAEEQSHSLAFPPAYLSKLTSSSPKNLSIISVKGDSMEKTLLDDDIVLLDRSKTHLGYDGLFVLRHNDTLHVKRVALSPKPGHVTIISDNRDIYPAYEARIEDLEVIGKVLWYGRKV